MVSMRTDKPICAPPRLSNVFPNDVFETAMFVLIVVSRKMYRNSPSQNNNNMLCITGSRDRKNNRETKTTTEIKYFA